MFIYLTLRSKKDGHTRTNQINSVTLDNCDEKLRKYQETMRNNTLVMACLMQDRYTRIRILYQGG